MLTFKQTLRRARRDNRGFTLIELLVVVLILSILMSVALPLYLNAATDSQRKTCRSNMQTIANAEQAFKVSDPAHQYTTDLTKLKDLNAIPKCPTGDKYGVYFNADGTFSVHCSNGAHDNNAPGQPGGYTPGKSSD